MNYFFYIIFISFVFGYDGPIDSAGDKSAQRSAQMDGNRILLYFENTTQLSDWNGAPLDYVSIWPNDGYGDHMLDGVALMVGAKTYIERDATIEVDTLVVDNPISIQNGLAAGNLRTIYFLQTGYREGMDQSDELEIDWGFYPVFGYFNSGQDKPAMSNDSFSWPSAWPASGTGTKWPGKWDGRFGEGVQYADLETYFVVNDAQDQEYLQHPEFRYEPIKGATIQQDASYQAGEPWGGLGIRVEARGFQWNNPLVRDALFWEYNISNISDYDINEVVFGYWVDNNVGGGGDDDDIGYFDIELDMSYSWDIDGVGDGQSDPGIMGFAFLESPGIESDNIDNDQDGLLNESRDNDAGSWICGGGEIYDLTAFLNFYGLDSIDQNWCHFEGDEDGDWFPSVFDQNGACVEVNDDVGLDGVGPNDLGYVGPDVDGTECNGIPDCVEGEGCEPNFGETDVSESDMLGLTSFQLFNIIGGTDEDFEDSDLYWFFNEETMWEELLHPSDEDEAFDIYGTDPSNLVQIFASGTFPLLEGRTERISMAELHSMDDIVQTPSNPSEDVPALFALKRTVQLIYETDYRFATPPNIPTLTAEAGDEKVVLSWNDVAESSVDRFLPDSLQQDFEGYKIYKATDKYFRDAQVITDGYGNPMFYEPIYQCDKIDGITGFADYATVFGAAYYLGSDSGIEHKYIDYDVQNGVTYYYAVVAYDYGLEPTDNMSSGIPPSENKALVELDENEYVIDTGPNVAVVIPTAPSAGYVPPYCDTQENLRGTGTLEVEVFNKSLVEDNQNYILEFENETDNENFTVTSGFSIYKEVGYCSEVCDEILYPDGCGVDCTSYLNQNECINDSNCEWIDRELMWEERGTDSEEGNYQNHFLHRVGYDIDNNELTPQLTYWTLDPNQTLTTDVIDGLVFSIRNIELGYVDTDDDMQWLETNNFLIQDPIVGLNERMYRLNPKKVKIIFADQIYQSRSIILAEVGGYQVLDENDSNVGIVPQGNVLGPTDILVDGDTFYSRPVDLNFYIYDEENGQYLDFLIIDDGDNAFNILNDKILVGEAEEGVVALPGLGWKGTHFSLEFNEEPSPGDIYSINCNVPFLDTDQFLVTTNAQDGIDVVQHNNDMNRIKVVPNPYVGSNMMEEAFSSSSQSQERKIMFTHLPSKCKIKIFTVSGVLVDEIEVDNDSNDGKAYWDLTSNEGLEVAAGMYIYHVQSEINSNYKMGKFGIIK